MTTMQDAEWIGKQVAEMAKEIEDGRVEYQEAMHALGEVGVPWAEDSPVRALSDPDRQLQLTLLGRIRWMAKRWNEAEAARGQLKHALGFAVAERDGVEEAMRHVREELGCKEGDSVLDAARAMVGIRKEVAEAVLPVMTSDRDVLLAVKSLVREVRLLRAKPDVTRMLRDTDFASRLDSPETMSDGELLATMIAQAEHDRMAVQGLLNEVDRAIPQEARDAALQVSGQIQTAMRMTAEKAREEWQRERATLVAKLQLVREALGCKDGENVVEAARRLRSVTPIPVSHGTLAEREMVARVMAERLGLSWENALRVAGDVQAAIGRGPAQQPEPTDDIALLAVQHAVFIALWVTLGMVILTQADL